MLLHGVTVIGFRSIEKAELASCGRFNVLIGKNNSGKSNLLSAILGFFDVTKSGEIINLHPKFSAEDDFFDRITKRPIELTCTFALTVEEAKGIFDSIAAEFPQIGNAVSGLRQSSHIKVTGKYFARPRPFSLISKVALGESSWKDDYTTIFEVADDVAPQVFSVFSQSANRREEAGNCSPRCG